MLQTVELHIAEPFRQRLTAAGLDRFEPLMHGEGLGVEVNRKPRQVVLRLDAAHGGFYLKRTWADPPPRVLRQMLHGFGPHVASLRELHMIRSLEAHGLPVMKAAAWGQRRTLGWPREGFLLVEAVPGRNVLELFAEGDDAARMHLAQAMGQLLGRLNHCGFFGALRLRDMIGPTSIHGDAPPPLVLIDRETHAPRPQRFSWEHAARCVARSYCKLRQMGHDLTPRQQAAFLDAYARAAAERQPPDQRMFIAAIGRHVRQLIASGAKYDQVRIHCDASERG